jgi:hypothetical protein
MDRTSDDQERENQPAVTGIVVMADYRADPIWAAEFDALAETDYEWPSEDRRRTWESAGRSLADRLARELGPAFTVTFRA